MILALFLLSAIFIDTVKAVDYKKYCDGEETVEDDVHAASLECDETAIILKYGDKYSTGKIIFTKKDKNMCKRLSDIFKNPQSYGKIHKNKQVGKSLIIFGVNECDSAIFFSQ